MKLHEIDKAIYECVDEETGEVDVEKLEALQNERSNKLENIALWILELSRDIEQIKSEKDRLDALKQRTERKVDRLKEYLAFVLNGENFKTPLVQIQSRKTKTVVIDDDAEIPEKFISVTITQNPNKTALKRAVESGAIINGVTVKEQIKAIIK